MHPTKLLIKILAGLIEEDLLSLQVMRLVG